MANEVEILEEYAKQIEEEAAAATKAEEAKVAYKDIDLQYIINWCQTHGEIDWLKAAAQEKVKVEVYPRKKVPAVDEVTGEQKFTKKGKVKYTSVADESKEPKVEERKITFIQLKEKFAKEFMPDILPKPKKKSMYDIIAEL